MLISPQATDTIYQAVLQLLKQQGVKVNEHLPQSVLLDNGMFLGYRFQGTTHQVDWLALSDVLVVKDREGRILLQKQLQSQESAIALPAECQQSSVAA